MSAPLDSLVLAVAESATFAASLDVFPRASLPPSIRAALALTMAPLLLRTNAAATVTHDRSVLLSALMNCLLLGLGASILGWAVRAAGGLIENALAPGLLVQGVFGGNGPFSRLYSLAFAFVFLSSGAYVTLVAALVSVTDAPATAVYVHAATRALALIHAFTLAALALAGPALLAQALAALIAGIVARVSQFVNGMLLSAPLGAAAILIVLMLDAPRMWSFIFQISEKVAALGHGLTG
ncbi:MAG: flagellar biosynthetic protein FliR [Candidatus Eremiobacteraeota bacterium]|nr:flagellar biosynthetic protein FliR [Candidatus Eremiobacteraeota bacterium]